MKMFGAAQRALVQFKNGLTSEINSAYSQATVLICDAICWRKFLPTFLYIGIVTGLYWRLVTDDQLEEQRILVLSGICGLLLVFDVTLRLAIFIFGGGLAQVVNDCAHQVKSDGLLPTVQKFGFYMITLGPLRSTIKSAVLWLYKFCTERTGEVFVILNCLICGCFLELKQIQYAAYFSAFSVVSTLLGPPLVYRQVPQFLWSQFCDFCAKVATFSILLFFASIAVTLNFINTCVEGAVAFKNGLRDFVVGTVRFCISLVVNILKLIRFIIFGTVNGVISLILGIYHGIINAIWAVKCAIVNGVLAVRNAIVRTVTAIISAVVNTYRTIVNGIVNGALFCWNSICFVYRTIQYAIVTTVVTTKNAIVNTVQTICTGVKNFCIAVVTTVTNFCTAVKNGIIRLLVGIRDGILAFVYGVKRAVILVIETILAGPKAVYDGLINLAIYLAVGVKNGFYAAIQAVKDAVEWVKDSILYSIRWIRDSIWFLLSTVKRKFSEGLLATKNFLIRSARRIRDATISAAQWCDRTARQFASWVARKTIEMTIAFKLMAIRCANWIKQKTIEIAKEIWYWTKAAGNWTKRKALVVLSAIWDLTCLYAAQVNAAVKDYIRNTWLEPIYLLLHELKEALKRYLRWKYQMAKDHLQTVWIQPAVDGVKWRCEAVRSYICEVVGGTAAFILEDLLRPSVNYVTDKIPAKAPYLEEDSDEEFEGFMPTEDFPLDLKVEPDGVLQGSDSEDEESYAPIIVESTKRRLSEPLHTDDSDDERDREGLAEVPSHDQLDESEDEFDLPKYSLPSLTSTELRPKKPRISNHDYDRAVTPPASMERKSSGTSLSESLIGMASQAYGAAASAATSLIVSRMLGGGVLSANEPQTVQKEDETDPEFELIENDELDNEDV